MFNQKTAVDNPSKLESLLTQIRDTQQEFIGSECICRACDRIKPQSQGIVIFYGEY